ncbi:TadE/TadG family type IV pilus assembly protein [Bacillus sp. FJAT-18017]|uniref:TadE/TadG family type IV pilus assembly protein n=1 Tax=Bacillus sp. FJAT-18017 TaxID=1705566 RepID=UPI0006AE648C|nr:TadE/TadG family type IV pilus assembly protein [Bacillus sp. FJAT-18017]
MRKGESGQSLVETALVLPLLLMLIAGIFDIGRLTYMYAHLHMAAQETVRKGGLGATDTEITEFAKNYVQVGDSSKLEISITPSGTVRRSGEYMTVRLKYPFRLYTPFVSSLFPNSLYAETDSTIRIE